MSTDSEIWFEEMFAVVYSSALPLSFTLQDLKFYLFLLQLKSVFNLNIVELLSE